MAFEFDFQYVRFRQQALITRINTPCRQTSNGVYIRYQNPILTAEHVPLEWRFDLNPETNPFFMERMGINAVFNPGAIYLNQKIYLVARVEGADRKSFFAVAESDTGIDQFRFWEKPIDLPQTTIPDVNVYDMRLTQHEDGWIYGVFCTERRDPHAPDGDTSSAVAQAGIVRTKDLKTWERLPDLKTKSAQQRNVVLHPEFVQAKYAFYTRPQDDFIETGSGGGIGLGLSNTIQGAEIFEERVIDPRKYHTIKETKNGQGPPPIKTKMGWLHLAHGVRNTAAGLRYVLYLFLSDLHQPWRVINRPAGFFMAPQGEERVGDVSNVLFSNGWVVLPDGRVLIYYASSDTRCHVAESSVERLLDYIQNTPQDGFSTSSSVKNRLALIQNNQTYLKNKDFKK